MSKEKLYNENFISDWNEYFKKSREKFKQKWEEKNIPIAPIDNFRIIRTLVTGGFGTIVLAANKKDETYHAVKMVTTKEGRFSRHVLNEQRTLMAANFPFLIRMDYYYKDEKYMYFIMPFIVGGDLWMRLRECYKFSENTARFYAAQIVLGLEYLHSLKIIYRDIKPENILIDEVGYLRITDFGFCKKVWNRTYTMCGTPEYLAPEVLLSQGYGLAVDWWSLGVLIYEMCQGSTPFAHKDRVTSCKRIVDCKYKMVSTFTPQLKDLIGNLLQKWPSRRYGNLKDGVADIKSHDWFMYTNWLMVLNKMIPAPFVPNVAGPWDDTYFR